ncbi:MAG: hypothetical protein HRT45_16565 [Bdellovibrionales bacterium]|nr:hypothetical protein [Bdellovibrionales bacterium]
MAKVDPKIKRDLLTGEIIEGETFEHLHPCKTRRDFLAAGLIKMTASVTLPSIATMLANQGYARAQEIVCPKGQNTTLPPFITVNLAGGAGLSANFVPHDQGGQPLSTYTRMGLGTTSTLPITYGFSNSAPFAGNGISQFFVGVTNETSVTTLQQAAFVAAPVKTRDDSSENKLNLEGMVAAAGRAGTILPHLGNNRNLDAFVPAPNPLNVIRFSSIEGALAIGGRLGSRLDKTQQASLFKAIEDLTMSQARGLASKSGGAELQKLVACSSQGNADLVGSNDPGVNPSSDTAFMNVWGMQNNMDMNSSAFTQAAIVYNVLKGNAAAGTINLGGYDYHNGTRSRGDEKDLEAGTVVGRILESFAVMGVKGFVVVTTDGGVTGPMSNSAGSPWTSDRGSAGMAYMIGYTPDGQPQASGFSMGHFLGGRSQQAVDQSFVTSGTAEMAAAGIFANYLSFSGQIQLLDAVLPRTFSTEDLDNILKLYS